MTFDGRRRHETIAGIVYVVARYTRSCSGCFEGGDYMGLAHHYDYDSKRGCYVGNGCDECGYTGKRREEDLMPAAQFYRAGRKP